jgi:hypothetical protein
MPAGPQNSSCDRLLGRSRGTTTQIGLGQEVAFKPGVTFGGEPRGRPGRPHIEAHCGRAFEAHKFSG